MLKYFRQIRWSHIRSTEKPGWCSKLPRPLYSSLERIYSADDQRWFEIYRIRPHLFAIYEPYHWEEAISYLIVGNRHSLMIDSGMGIGNIRQAIEPLISSSNRLTLINTHTHHDHIGDNWRFDGSIIGVDTKFSKENARGSIDEAKNELQPGMIWEKHLPETFDRENYQIHPFKIDRFVKEGDEINLDENVRLKIFETPGHSPDSISLFDEKRRLLFIGDLLYPGPILLYRPEANLKDYLDSLEKLEKITDRLDILLPGHNVPVFPSKTLIKAAQSMRDIIKGNIDGKLNGDTKHLEFSFDEFSFVIDPKLFSSING